MALTDGLTHWWDLDEESGTRLDSHGLKDLTDRNTVGSIVVGSGRAASFVAANDEQLYADGIQNPTDQETPFSIVVRFKIPEIGGGGDLFRPAVKDDTARLAVNASGRLTLTMAPTRTVYVDTTPGEWHRVVCVYDGITYIWVDGILAVADELTRRETAQVGDLTNGRLCIGNGKNALGQGGVPLQGDIDFVGYWHERALTEEEITALQSVTSYADLTGGTPDPVTVTADFTPIPVTSYGAVIVQGQQVAADYTQVPIESYGAGVVISPVQIGASFDQIPVTSYGAGVEISPVEVGASYTAIPVTSYDAQAIPGSTGIGATYTEVPVYSFDASITQGRIVSAAYDEISVTSYDAAVIPGAIGIGADYTLIPVESYSAGITQGVGIGAEYTEIPVTSFAASIIQGLRIGVTYTEVPVTSYSAEIEDGSIVRPNTMECSVSPYYHMDCSVSPYYDMTATVKPAIQ